MPAAGSLVFTGYGEAGSMKFVSPSGVLLSQPTNDPIPGDGVLSIVTLRPSGIVGIVGGNSPNFGTTGTGTFNTNGTFRAEYTGASFAGRAGCAVGEKFYSAKRLTTGGNPLGIFEYDADGNLTNSWSIAYGGGASSDSYSPAGLAIYGTTAYVFLTYANLSFVQMRAVRTYSLAGAGSYIGEPYSVTSLVAFGGYNRLLALSDGTVVFSNPADQTLKRYAAGFGSVTATYVFPAYTIVELAHGLTTATFWASGSMGPGSTNASEFQISSGAVLRTVSLSGGGFLWDGPFVVLVAEMSTTEIDDPGVGIRTVTECCATDDGTGVRSPGDVKDEPLLGWTPSITGGAIVPAADVITLTEAWDF